MPSLRDMLEKARRALLKRGVHLQDADDLVQEAYLRVKEYEKSQIVKSQEAILVTTAVNLSLDKARRRSKSPFVDFTEDLLEAPDNTPPPDEILRSQQQLKTLSAALQHLPDKTRRILLSRRLDGLSFKDIAAAEGMTVTAVEKQVARATLELMKWMDGW